MRVWFGEHPAGRTASELTGVRGRPEGRATAAKRLAPRFAAPRRAGPARRRGATRFIGLAPRPGRLSADQLAPLPAGTSLPPRSAARRQARRSANLVWLAPRSPLHDGEAAAEPGRERSGRLHRTALYGCALWANMAAHAGLRFPPNDAAIAVRAARPAVGTATPPTRADEGLGIFRPERNTRQSEGQKSCHRHETN
jgi:hypothetical protein